MNLNKHVLGPAILALAFGALALPALADINLSFGRHDYNHDGRWSYNEFRDANVDYYHHHHGVQILGDRELRHEFRRLDRDNNGYVGVEEIRTYHDWD